MGGSGYSDTPWHWKCWVGGHGGACEEPIIFIKNIKWWICWMNSTYIFCFTRTCQISAPENYSKLGAEEKRKTKKKHAANSFYLSPSHSVLSLACMWLTGIVNTVYMSRREWHKRLERRFKFFKEENFLSSYPPRSGLSCCELLYFHAVSTYVLYKIKRTKGCARSLAEDRAGNLHVLFSLMFSKMFAQGELSLRWYCIW